MSFHIEIGPTSKLNILIQKACKLRVLLCHPIQFQGYMVRCVESGAFLCEGSAKQELVSGRPHCIVLISLARVQCTVAARDYIYYRIT